MKRSDPRRGRLRVLVVAGSEPWPLTSGASLRLHHFLRHLSRDLGVTLAIPAAPHSAESALPGLRIEVMQSPGAVRARGTSLERSEPERQRGAYGRCCTAALRAGPSSARYRREDTPALHDPPDGRPWIARRIGRHFGWSPHVAGWLRANATPERFDVALLYGPLMGQYVRAVRTPVVWDAVDDLVLYAARDTAWRQPRRWTKLLRALTLYALYERHVARRAHATVFASTVDASYARRWVGEANIQAISNGVDLDHYQPATQDPQPGTVVFVGSLAFPPNLDGIVDFTTRIWPRVQRRLTGARLLIVGRMPTERIRALTQLTGVELHADVPDVRPYVERATAVIVPTRMGGGVKNKVLEACAMARPVVASPLALGGLTARRGRDVLCAATVDAWVRHLGRLLTQRDYAAAVGRHGRQWVQHAHHWPSLAARLRELLEQTATQVTGKMPMPPCQSPSGSEGHRAGAALRAGPSSARYRREDTPALLSQPSASFASARALITSGQPSACAGAPRPPVPTSPHPDVPTSVGSRVPTFAGRRQLCL